MRGADPGNAYQFYEKYGSETVFLPTSKTDGKIYFASRGASASSGTKYKTIGWKMIVSNSSGSVKQNLYFKLGGSYLTPTNTLSREGYVYNLYSVKLSSILSRLNSAAQSLFEKGTATIRLNACMVVSRNGNLSGTMTDAGPLGGQVYTTYSGIVSAANWSSNSLEALKSYFGKEVTGLFFKVKVGKGKGIKTVTGAGTYVYGSKVSISATCATGYIFSKWTGPSTQTKQIYSFYVNENSSWVANATAMKTKVTYYRNHSTEDQTRKTDTFVYGKTGQKLLQPSWSRTGYTLLGWAFEHDSDKANYKLNSEVKASWIAKYYAAVNLYAIWKPNTYVLQFWGTSKNGKTQVVYQTKKVTWGNSVTFPKPSETIYDFAGWKSEYQTIYKEGEKATIKTIATAAGVGNTNQSVINFYAISDSKPMIEAENLYFTLKQAKSGALSESYLSSFFYAYDRQDGEIVYGNRKTNGFVIQNYRNLKWKEMEDRDSVDLILVARDCDGNVAQKTVKLTVVDTTMRTPKKVTVRFVSGQYAKENYYLSAQSKWLQDPNCRALLEAATKKEETP